MSKGNALICHQGKLERENKLNLRDRLLIMGKKGYKTVREGGQVKYYPYKNGGGGAEKVLAMLKVAKRFGVVLTGA